MKTRNISSLLYSQVMMMGGMQVKQPFPSREVEQIDPFILLHHHQAGPSNHQRFEGVGPHPHRGFSPVTFVLEGSLRHRDTLGNDSVISAGGVQWMDAGKGLVHSERPLDPLAPLELIQLWINTPAHHKMDEPQYFPLDKKDVPQIASEDGLSSISLYSGEGLGLKGPISSNHEVFSAFIEMKKGGKMEIVLPAHHNAFLYTLDGLLAFEDYGQVKPYCAVVFANDGDCLSWEALENTRLLLVSAAPLEEQVVSHGPFVMTTEEEIWQAMKDYEDGKMGVLVES